MGIDYKIDRAGLKALLKSSEIAAIVNPLAHRIAAYANLSGKATLPALASRRVTDIANTQKGARFNYGFTAASPAADQSVRLKLAGSHQVDNAITALRAAEVWLGLKPEENAELFYFCEDALQQLDQAEPAVTANFPLFFALHLSHFYGFRINNAGPAQLQAKALWLDLMEGSFTEAEPPHSFYLQKEDALVTAELLQMMQPHELEQLKLNHHKRRYLLQKYLEYYALHIPEFGQMKTLPVLQEVLG